MTDEAPTQSLTVREKKPLVNRIHGREILVDITRVGDKVSMVFNGRPKRVDKWMRKLGVSMEELVVFIEELSKHGLFTKACITAGVGIQRMRLLRDRVDTFKALCDVAEDIAADKLEEAALQMAVEGDKVTEYFSGGQIKKESSKKYDSIMTKLMDGSKPLRYAKRYIPPANEKGGGTVGVQISFISNVGGPDGKGKVIDVRVNQPQLVAPKIEDEPESKTSQDEDDEGED